MMHVNILHFQTMIYLAVGKMAGVAAERCQVHDRAGAAAHRLPSAGHDAGARRRPRQRQLRGLRQPAELRPQPPPPGRPPPAPAEAPGRRHRLRRLLRRAPRRHAEPGEVRLHRAFQDVLRLRRRRLQLRPLRHLRLAGGQHGLRPAGQVRQLGRRPHDGGNVQGRRRHVLPGRRHLLPPGVQRSAGCQESPGQLTAADITTCLQSLLLAS
uniref:Uncharacterized protein n=1 Tax=Arundo donax TaxID=35708 RepID=A0A0A9CRR5_ARUDO